MLAWLRQRSRLRRTARVLYGSIVTQARSPGLYAAWGAPDTPEGRFEMIILHLVLVLRRLGREAESGSALLAQALTEAFVVDLDDTLREMTVGDLAVPRHVKRAVAAVHDRYATYGAALAEPANAPLADAVEQRLSALSGAEGLDVQAICAYIRGAAEALDRRPGRQILDGELVWPEVRT